MKFDLAINGANNSPIVVMNKLLSYFFFLLEIDIAKGRSLFYRGGR